MVAGAGLALEAVSFAGYVWLLRAVVRQGGREMSPAAGWRLTLAGVAATAPRAVGQARRRPGALPAVLADGVRGRRAWRWWPRWPTS